MLKVIILIHFVYIKNLGDKQILADIGEIVYNYNTNNI